MAIFRVFRRVNVLMRFYVLIDAGQLLSFELFE